GAILLFAPGLYAQNVKLVVPIQTTGGSVSDTLDDGTIVTLSLSSDDCEQENDEIDTPYDDDLDAGWEGAPEDQNILTTGLRFRDIFIPKGSVIDSAFIYVTSHEGKTTDDVAEITIWGEATDDAVTFNETDLITDRPSTSAKVEWVVDTEWIIWKEYRTPNISSIIEEIVARSGWESGNSLAIVMEGKDQGPSDFENAREFEAFENISDPEDVDPDGNPGDGKNHPERVPRLEIYFTAPQYTFSIPIQATEGSVTDTLDDGTIVTLLLSSDDCEQENDEIDTPYDDDLDAGWEGAPEDQNILTTGLRFRDINIPQGASIDSAFVEVYSHEGKSTDDVAEITIWAEATDNAETFNETDLITARTPTQAKVDWVVDTEWVIWQPYKTADIAPVIQEIINRPGWQKGNAIALVLQGKDQGPSDFENAREFESFENISDPEDVDPEGNPGDGKNHPERVPRLFVYYTLGTSSATASFSQENTMMVYPNPAGEYIQIEFSNDSPSMISIFDLSGKKIKSFETNSSTSRIDISDLKKGVYILNAIRENTSSSKRLVVN
ncbi:MAG: T9SS type A sorting domain-containing protein, partial [Bacteroidales bacterium]